MSEQTFGQKAVGLSFNPSNDDKVGQIKLKFAELIDLLHNEREVARTAVLNTLSNGREATVNEEIKRMLSIAITDLQSAQMWAVKAVTWS